MGDETLKTQLTQRQQTTVKARSSELGSELSTSFKYHLAAAVLEILSF
jgi:hypothetical protein